jgi:hypothetical protein
LDIKGLERNLLYGRFILIVNNIEYGFPAVVVNNHVEVKLSPLIEVISNIETYKSYMKAKLMIFSDCQYFIPWEGKAKIMTPKKVTATLSKNRRKPIITSEDVELDFEEQEEIIVDDPEEPVSLPDPTKKEKTNPVVEKKKVTRKPQTESRVLNESTRDEYLEKLKNIDEKGIRDYMKRAGTKSAHIQDIILEQADAKCKDSDDKFELLKSVVKIMNEIKKGPKDGMSL